MNAPRLKMNDGDKAAEALGGHERRPKKKIGRKKEINDTVNATKRMSKGEERTFAWRDNEKV